MFHQVFENDLRAKRIDVQNIGANTIVVWIGLANSLQNQCDGTEGEEYSFHDFGINRVDNFFGSSTRCFSTAICKHSL